MPLENFKLLSAHLKLPDDKFFHWRDEMFVFLIWRRHAEVESSWTLLHQGLEDIVRLSTEPPCADGRRQFSLLFYFSQLYI